MCSSWDLGTYQSSFPFCTQSRSPTLVSGHPTAAMVALAVTLPLVPSTLSRRSFRSRPSNYFSVSSILSSHSLVYQSSKCVQDFESGNVIPLHQCIFSDHLTPVLAYRCLVNQNDQEAPSFLIESVDSGLHTTSVGRYSIVGANPAMEVVAKENLVTVMDHREGWRTEEFLEDPLVIPSTITEKWTPRCLGELPQVFCGGWVGYFSYDTVRYSEKRLTFSSAPVDDRNLPHVHLGLYDDVLVFDHVEKKVHVIHWVQLDRFPSTEAAMENGKHRLKSLLSRVHDIVNPTLSNGSIDLDTRSTSPKLDVSSTAAEAYKNLISRAKKHILAGDISQVVLSQRFERRTFVDPFEVYRALSIVNPSPFMAYIQVRGCVLVSSSPEILTYVEKKVKTTSLSCWDALRTALPLGTFTGESKHKAMQLIDELEVSRRGPYGGGFGCISFSGDMDLALASKTIVFPTGMYYDSLYSYKNRSKRREWVAYLQTGATIVADSDPREAARECETEAAILAQAIDLAESAFLDN